MGLMTRRFIASVIDHFIIAFIIMLISLAVPNIPNKIEMTWISLPPNKTIIMLCSVIVLYLIKDIIFINASIGKKIVGICVTTDSEDKKITIRQLVLRNLSLILFFWIEFLILFISRKKRLGDVWAKTKVIMR